MTTTWIEEYYSGSEGPEGPEGPAGPAGDGLIVDYGENIDEGDVICSANSSINPNLVVKAIAAALETAGEIRGVAKESGLAGDTGKPIYGPGDVVPPDTLGISSAAQEDAVTVNTATARAVRTTIATLTTAQWVLGGCDAEGNTTIRPKRANELHVPFTPTRSHAIHYDGTKAYTRKDRPHPKDFGAVNDGSDQSVALQAWLDAICKSDGHGSGYIDPPGGFADPFVFQKTLTIFNDTEGGNARDWHIFGGPRGNAGLRPHFRCEVPCPSGDAATVVSYYSGTGRPTMVLNIGPSSDITVATKEDWIGANIRTWHTGNTNADILHHFVSGYVVGVAEVAGETHLTIDQPRAGAAGTATYNGSIRWRVWKPGIEIRSTGWMWDGLLITAGTGRFGPLIEIGEPYRAGAMSVNGFWLRRFHLSGQSTALMKNGIVVARDIVPRGGSGYSANAPQYTGRNGNGDLQVVSSVQVDEYTIEEGKIAAFDEVGIELHSTNGQSKTGAIKAVSFAQGGRNYTGFDTAVPIGGNAGIGVGCPRQKWNAGNTWSSVGLPQAIVRDCVFGATDIGVLFGGSTSGWVQKIENLYGEGVWRIAVSPNTTFGAVVLRDIKIQFPSGICHPSKEFVVMSGEGPLRLDNLELTQPDNSGIHIVQNSSPNTKTGMCIATDIVLFGNPGWKGRRARQTAACAGPYDLSTDNTLTGKVNGGNTITWVATLNNFARVGLTTNIDLAEVDSVQLGKLLNGWSRQQNAVYDVGAVIQTAHGLAANPPVTYVVTAVASDQKTANVSDPTAGWSTTIANTVVDGNVTLTVYGAFNWWGESDNAPPTYQSGRDYPDGTSSVQITGGSMNNELQFTTGGVNPTAVQTQLCIDTHGFLDHNALGGATIEPTSYELTMFGAMCFPSTGFAGTHLSMPCGVTRYGTQHAVYNEIRTAAGGSFTAPASGGGAKALTLKGGGTTIAGAVTSSAANDITVADPRITARSNVSKLVKKDATAVTLGDEYISAQSAGSVTFTFGGPPAGTEQFDYSVTEPT